MKTELKTTGDFWNTLPDKYRERSFNMERKYTPGPWEARPETNSTGNYSIETIRGPVYIAQTIGGLDSEQANAHLLAAAPDLLEALEAAQSLICRLKLSLLAHPDCIEGSEFDDYTSSAQEMEDKIQEVLNKAYGKEESTNG